MYLISLLIKLSGTMVTIYHTQNIVHIFLIGVKLFSN